MAQTARTHRPVRPEELGVGATGGTTEDALQWLGRPPQAEARPDGRNQLAADVDADGDTGVVTPPNPGSSELALLNFARALGSRLGLLSEEVARLQAAVIQSATTESSGEFERGLYEGLRLALRGHAGRVVLDQERTELAEGEGPAVQRVLAALSVARTPQRPTELAATLGVTQPYLSRLLKAMTEDQLLVRSTASIPTDKRAVTYALSAAGEDVLLAGRRTGLIAAAEPTAEEIRRTRLRSARSMLEGVQERRRKGQARDLDVDVLNRIYKTALADEDQVLAVDVIGEQATAGRQNLLALPAPASKSGTGNALTVLKGMAGTDSYALARHQYELGKRELATTGRVGVAWERFMRTEELLGDSPHAPIRVWNELALSECSRMTGKVFDAVDYAERAYDVALGREDSFATVKSGIQLGLAYRTIGMVEPCDALLTSVLELASTHAYPHLIAESRFHLGEATRYRGHIDEAARLLERATRELREAGGSPRGLAFAVSALGACYFDEGLSRVMLTRSRDMLAQALEISERANAIDAQALTMRRLGYVTIVLGEDPVRGGKFIERALSMYRTKSTTSLVGQLECHANLVELGVTKPRLRSAIDVLKRVRDRANDVVVARDRQVRIVDRWVMESLRGGARRLDDDESTEVVTQCWSDLKARGVAGSERVQKGRSAMGKEPALVRSIPR